MQQMLAAMREFRKGPPSTSAPSGGQRAEGGRSFQRRLPIVPHLTPDQVKEHMAAGKCFGCGSKEHSARGCPKRKMINGKPSWSN